MVFVFVLHLIATGSAHLESLGASLPLLLRTLQMRGTCGMENIVLVGGHYTKFRKRILVESVYLTDVSKYCLRILDCLEFTCLVFIYL